MEVLMQGERMLTVAQVAERLQVAPKTVRRWLHEGRLQGRMLGGTKAGYRISEAALAAFIAGDQAGKAKAAA
jgi:excisionase family DNA binding protein